MGREERVVSLYFDPNQQDPSLTHESYSVTSGGKVQKNASKKIVDRAAYESQLRFKHAIPNGQQLPDAIQAKLDRKFPPQSADSSAPRDQGSNSTGSKSSFELVGNKKHQARQPYQQRSRAPHHQSGAESANRGVSFSEVFHSKPVAGYKSGSSSLITKMEPKVLESVESLDPDQLEKFASKLRKDIARSTNTERTKFAKRILKTVDEKLKSQGLRTSDQKTLKVESKETKRPVGFSYASESMPVAARISDVSILSKGKMQQIELLDSDQLKSFVLKIKEEPKSLHCLQRSRNLLILGLLIKLIRRNLERLPPNS